MPRVQVKDKGGSRPAHELLLNCRQISFTGAGAAGSLILALALSSGRASCARFGLLVPCRVVGVQIRELSGCTIWPRRYISVFRLTVDISGLHSVPN